MQVGDGVSCGSRLRYRIAAAELVSAERGAGAIVGADPGEGSNLRKHGFARIWLHAPDVGAVAQAGLENDDRAPGSLAFEIELPAAADVDQAGEVAASRDGLSGLGAREQHRQGNDSESFAEHARFRGLKGERVRGAPVR